MEIQGQFSGTLELKDISQESEKAVIGEGLNSLLLVRKGTMPGNRGFGTSMKYISAPNGETALNLIGMELQEASDKYIRGISVRSVTGGYDRYGKLDAKIKVERR